MVVGAPFLGIGNRALRQLDEQRCSDQGCGDGCFHGILSPFRLGQRLIWQLTDGFREWKSSDPVHRQPAINLAEEP
jgi:hypothetical protein